MTTINDIKVIEPIVEIIPQKEIEIIRKEINYEKNDYPEHVCSYNRYSMWC